MRTITRARLESVALWLAVIILVLCGALVFIMRPPKEEPVRESQPYYHIIGGLEEDVGHVIKQGYP